MVNGGWCPPLAEVSRSDGGGNVSLITQNSQPHGHCHAMFISVIPGYDMSLRIPIYRGCGDPFYIPGGGRCIKGCLCSMPSTVADCIPYQGLPLLDVLQGTVATVPYLILRVSRSVRPIRFTLPR